MSIVILAWSDSSGAVPAATLTNYTPAGREEEMEFLVEQLGAAFGAFNFRCVSGRAVGLVALFGLPILEDLPSRRAK